LILKKLSDSLNWLPPIKLDLSNCFEVGAFFVASTVGRSRES
jgi:hypothetical protein